MKTKLFLPGILVLGLAAAPMVAISSPVNATAIETSFDQERQEKQDKDKVKIEKDKLPQRVQDAIKNDRQTGEATIKEAWQMTGDDGQVYYAIKFDHNGNEMSKKYDAMGKEKKDKKDD
ncbi:hypothetical protein [Mongoliibacter ruber]|uniref:PepSY domain-containing protein n=1 Tax=Mongoliibacter ruber TaxID=1750599 RepID=A0A2T0WL58_9BACT|nr:hypothetical protein [Mongoliibacter ruber]PRY87415.1 hypothetical protein CLW00_10634 [Mongoliibacter ruber]